jgi:hypothetical protein
MGLFDTERDYTLEFTVTHTPVSTVTSSLTLLGSSFQRRPFLLLWVFELSSASAISFSQQQLTIQPKEREREREVAK